MKFRSALCLLATCVSWNVALQAQPANNDAPSRPNILWITSEDNAAHWLGCYGNDEANTPRIDALARESVLFQNAFANAPVCAVARSTILTGCHAPAIGTQHMRSRYRIPKKFRPYVSYLRDHGYYCTNRSKTDYNIAGNDKKIWDACSREAHYRNRDDGQPFFAIFNITVSHESSLFPDRVRNNRRNGVIPKQTRLDPDKLTVPPCLPDLPEVRSDIAIYHDNLTELDRRIGQLLDELDEAGLTKDTIVFYYSDHGGPTPRGKRYLHDTGVRVPMLIRVPERWKSVSPFTGGAATDELVSFVDLAPTLLSLCGIEVPSQMQGRPFLGKQRVEPSKDGAVFLYADRFDGVVGMRRGLRDKRYKYIRRFTPHLPAAPYSQYSLGVPSWKAWQESWKNQKLTEQFAAIWQTPQPNEMLFDTIADPWEINNLATNPEFGGRLFGMRRQLQQLMISINDSSIVPESLFEELINDGTIHDYLLSTDGLVDRRTYCAFSASDGNPESLPDLAHQLESSTDPVIHYWSLSGLQLHGQAARKHVDKIRARLEDNLPAIRIAAAQALLATGDAETGRTALLSEFQPPYDKSAGTTIQLINAAQQAGLENDIPHQWVQHILDNKQKIKHIQQFAERIVNER